MLRGDGLHDSAGRNGIRSCIVRIGERHAIYLGGVLEASLALAIAIDSLIDDQRVEHRGWVDNRLEPVTQGLILQNREVIGSVVGNNRDASSQKTANGVNDFGYDFSSRATVLARVFSRDTVNIGCDLRYLDARVGKSLDCIANWLAVCV